MSEGNDRQQGPETGEENEETAETLRKAGTGGEGTNPAQATPPIEGGGQHADQTQTPAADDDVGVPEEIDERTD